jgi:hypothetical protein
MAIGGSAECKAFNTTAKEGELEEEVGLKLG